MTPQEKWEFASLIVGGFITLMGGPPAIRKGLEWWAGRREAAKKRADEVAREVALASIAARTAEVEREADHDERTEDRLWTRVDALEGKIEARDDTIARLRTDVDKCTHDRVQLEESERRCREDVRELQEQIGRMVDNPRSLPWVRRNTPRPMPAVTANTEEE